MFKPYFLLALSIFIQILQGTPYCNASEHSNDNFQEDFTTSLPKGCLKYLEKLPKLESGKEDDLNIQAKKIAHFIQAFDTHQQIMSEEKERVQKIIENQLKRNEPIHLTIVGFSCKSSNVDVKVLASSFDLADYMGLCTLNYITQSIRHIYSPGAKITIVSSEPHLLEINKKVEEKLKVPMIFPESIEKYQSALKKCLKHFPDLALGKDLTQAYGKMKDTPQNFEQEEGELLQKIAIFFQEELKTDHIKKAFMKQENLVELSNGAFFKKLKPLSQTIAEVYLKGVKEFRTLLCKETSENTIRFSIHGDKNKIGINLIYGSKGAPWHNLVRVHKDGIELLSKKKASEKGEIQVLKMDDMEMQYILSKD
jgi:pyoverdine/dityrosine biosynthesis protein Dit1